MVIIILVLWMYKEKAAVKERNWLVKPLTVSIPPSNQHGRYVHKMKKSKKIDLDFLLNYYSACHPRMDYTEVIICSCIFKRYTERCDWR
jgi:hypothetical protein